MCDVFYINQDSIAAVRKMVNNVDPRIPQMDLGRDIHPTDAAPVIVGNGIGMRLACQRWGYTQFNITGVKYKAKVESAVQNISLFSDSSFFRRVVIPTNHFYEWNVLDEKNVFSRMDGDTLYLAGFIAIKKDENCFVILTTHANRSVVMVHDRMPLVLEKCQVEDWIFNDRSIDKILQQVPVMLERQDEFEQLSLF